MAEDAASYAALRAEIARLRALLSRCLPGLAGPSRSGLVSEIRTALDAGLR